MYGYALLLCVNAKETQWKGPRIPEKGTRGPFDGVISPGSIFGIRISSANNTMYEEVLMLWLMTLIVRNMPPLCFFLLYHT